MIRLFSTIFLAATLLAQGNGQTVNIPIPNQPPFTLGYGATLAQTLSVSPSQLQPAPDGSYDGVYQFKFSVKNYFPSYPGYYTAEIDFGTQELCEASGWGTYGFTEVMITCPGSAFIVVDKSLPGGGPVQGRDNFVIHFTVNDGSLNGGWPLVFKNVSLMFTPN